MKKGTIQLERSQWNTLIEKKIKGKEICTKQISERNFRDSFFSAEQKLGFIILNCNLLVLMQFNIEKVGYNINTFKKLMGFKDQLEL